MPWAVKDVESHKKGLSAKQKKKWVAVANSVRSKCIKEGGSEKECDAKAIRIANGSTMKGNINVNFRTASAYKVREEVIGNQDYLIVPVVMMVEGVHTGNQGPILHYAEELEKSVPEWEGKPVTVMHPIIDGEYVSAFDERVQTKVGFVRNAYMDGKKLKAEACINVQKLAAVSPETLEYIEQETTLEVSIGIFAEDEEEKGIWNNEEYEVIARNYKPDHLALLPGGVGACSVVDGCGIRVNKKGGKNVNVNEAFKSLMEHGHFTFHLNKEGYQEIIEKIWDYFSKKENDTKLFHLVDVYDDYVVYHMRNKVDNSVTMFKQDYMVNEDGSINLTGEPQKVRRDVSYIVVNEKEKVINNQKKEVKMCVKCPEKVDALIAHSATHFTDEDREWLDKMTEDQLDKLIPKVYRRKTEKPVVIDAGEITVQEAWNVIQNNSKSVDDYLKGLPENVRQQFEKGVEIYTSERKKVVDSILANSEQGEWTENELNDMKLEVLQKIEKALVKRNENNGHVYMQGRSDLGVKTVKPMPIPGVEFKD